MRTRRKRNLLSDLDNYKEDVLTKDKKPTHLTQTQPGDVEFGHDKFDQCYLHSGHYT